MEAEDIGHLKRGLAFFLLRLWFPALAFLLAAIGNPAFGVYAAEIQVTIDFPPDGSSFARPAPQAIIAGHARVRGTLAPLLDLAIVIDRSGSTANPSGADLDGDGTVGVLRRLNFPFRLQDLLEPRTSDPDDSVLSAELAGAGILLSFLDPASTRVSVISFGRDLFVDGDHGYPWGHRGPFTYWDRGGYPWMPDALVEQPLTLDYRGIQKALARKVGIEIHTYALGPKAVVAPFALTEIARITGGRFHPISDPSQVVFRLKEFIFAQLKSLVVKNATLGRSAGQVALGPEGAYIAVVPVKAGVNKITVTGIANDGTRGGTSILLNYLPTGERDPALQPAKREMALSPDVKSFDDLKRELEEEKNRWLELNRKTKELELKTKEKGKDQEQLELDLEVK